MGNNLSYKKDFGLVVVGAILFTASFLWIEFLMEVQNVYFPKSQGLSRRFLYTLVITVILVGIAVLLRSYFGLNNGKDVSVEGRTTRATGGDVGMMGAAEAEAAGTMEAAAENTGLHVYGMH